MHAEPTQLIASRNRGYDEDMKPLETELTTYQKEKGRLLAEYPDKFVLIKNQSVVGVFASQDDALAQGYKQFGNTEFLVKKIVEFEDIGNFTRALI